MLWFFLLFALTFTPQRKPQSHVPAFPEATAEARSPTTEQAPGPPPVCFCGVSRNPKE